MASWTKEIQGREEQRQLKGQALLRTAARLFNETGFHQTTLEMLAQRLGVTKPTLYYYIKNKDDILFECNRLALMQAQEALEKAQAEGTTGLEKLRVLVTRYVHIVTEDFGICLILSGDQALTQENRQALRTFRTTLDHTVRVMLEEGMRDGSIAPCNPKMVTFALFGAFNWIAHWYKDDGELKPEEIAEHFLSLFENGLVPRTKS
ncbi:MAG: TetR family transcriptional regulator [Chloroflexi bacterium]|nr:TetR family transcriptional regulator [Chloroflexota bacterium]OJV92160.1 MAG: hypothetical protein BGO39_09600 [Chloroflexi bacterium 54-19]